VETTGAGKVPGLSVGVVGPEQAARRMAISTLNDEAHPRALLQNDIRVHRVAENAATKKDHTMRVGCPVGDRHTQTSAKTPKDFNFYAHKAHTGLSHPIRGDQVLCHEFHELL